MAFKQISSLAHFLIITLVYVEVTSKCRKIPEVKHDFKKLSGIWYLIQSSDSTEQARSCVKYDFVYSKTKKTEVITAYRIVNNESQKKFIATLSNGKAECVALNNDGTYATGKMVLKIAAGDYVNYFADYVCDRKSQFEEFVYVGVRNKSMETYYNKLMMKKWKNLDFDMDKIFRIEQQNCPETD